VNVEGEKMPKFLNMLRGEKKKKVKELLTELVKLRKRQMDEMAKLAKPYDDARKVTMAVLNNEASFEKLHAVNNAVKEYSRKLMIMLNERKKTDE
jgi:hypothetical protein